MKIESVEAIAIEIPLKPTSNASIPSATPVWQAAWTNRPSIKDGSMEVSRQPGFGIELDWELVERYRVA